MCARAARILAPQPALVPRTGCGGLQSPGVASSGFGLSLMALGRSARRSPRGRVAARRVATGRHKNDEANLGAEPLAVKWTGAQRGDSLRSGLTERELPVAGRALSRWRSGMSPLRTW